MANRLSRIVTKTGDRGETGLGSGLRVDKDSPVIETLGAIDELNSWIGVVVTFSASDQVKQVLTFIQHDLFDLGAQVSVPGTALLSARHLARLDEGFQQINSKLSPLKEFILPGGLTSAAFAHVARTVCRRAERRLCGLVQLQTAADRAANGTTSPVSEDFGLPYLNRLSDLLFVISRLENVHDGGVEIYWERGKSLSN
jgi:cob(I)alamin adenosyltransferase